MRSGPGSYRLTESILSATMTGNSEKKIMLEKN